MNDITIVKITTPCYITEQVTLSEKIAWSKDDPVMRMVIEKVKEKYKEHCPQCIENDHKNIISVGEYEGYGDD